MKGWKLPGSTKNCQYLLSHKNGLPGWSFHCVLPKIPDAICWDPAVTVCFPPPGLEKIFYRERKTKLQCHLCRRDCVVFATTASLHHQCYTLMVGWDSQSEHTKMSHFSVVYGGDVQVTYTQYSLLLFHSSFLHKLSSWCLIWGPWAPQHCLLMNLNFWCWLVPGRDKKKWRIIELIELVGTYI